MALLAIEGIMLAVQLADAIAQTQGVGFLGDKGKKGSKFLGIGETYSYYDNNCNRSVL